MKLHLLPAKWYTFQPVSWYIIELVYTTDTVRVNYDRIYKGTLICSEIKSFLELHYTSKSNIKHSLFLSYKGLTIPILKEMSLYIQCKKIYIDNFDIYVLQNDRLILETEYREILKSHIENKSK